jgi:hypothetical protein
MAGNRFNNSLRLAGPTGGQISDPRPAPLARGPVADGDELTWMQVWLLQNPRRGRAAAAWGTGPLGAWGGGASRPRPFTGSWRIQTELAPGSDTFTRGKPALASAMALVHHTADDTTEVEWWSVPVLIGD